MGLCLPLSSLWRRRGHEWLPKASEVSYPKIRKSKLATGHWPLSAWCKIIWLPQIPFSSFFLAGCFSPTQNPPSCWAGAWMQWALIIYHFWLVSSKMGKWIVTPVSFSSLDLTVLKYLWKHMQWMNIENSITHHPHFFCRQLCAIIMHISTALYSLHNSFTSIN